MQSLNFNRMAKSISDEIEFELDRIGLFYRIFNRVKTSESVEKKLKVKNYLGGESKMQDLIGIRIVAYFKDDIQLIVETIKSKFDFVDSKIDEEEDEIFKPSRLNLIFRLSKENTDELNASIGETMNVIDNTYEIQIRTIFSEGWHEVEHDLRYKCQDEWEDQKDFSRVLNGMYASLETTDWSILSLFDQMAHFHYKNKNLKAMLRNKFRIRFKNDDIPTEIFELIESKNLYKKLYKFDRIKLLTFISIHSLRMPLSLINMIFLINHISLKDSDLQNKIPFVLKQSFQEIKQKSKSF